jgi:ABC-type glycerol-3-phosphate transport system permease component
VDAVDQDDAGRGRADPDLSAGQEHGLLDTVSGLIIIYTLINLPIAVWMAFTYFNDVPKEILEAARIDGANAWQEIIYLLLPMPCRDWPPPACC